MRKKSAIEQLIKQQELLIHQSVHLSKWFSGMASLLIKIFPQSGEDKVDELMELLELPEFYGGSEQQNQLEVKRNRAFLFITNQIEEVETFGLETKILYRLFGG